MNKLRHLGFIICIWFYGSVFGQFRTAVIDGELTDTAVCISLYKNGKYLIALQEESDGNIVEIAFLSLGNYLYRKDTVILTDAYYNYSLKFLRKNTVLIPVKFFSWLKCNPESYGYDFDVTYADMSDHLINRYKPISYAAGSNRYKLYYHRYEYNNCSLTLKKGNYYTCMLNSLMVSEGKFVYNGQYIKFYDRHLNFTFIGIVGQNSVCVGFLPFRNAWFILKK